MNENWRVPCYIKCVINASHELIRMNNSFNCIIPMLAFTESKIGAASPKVG